MDWVATLITAVISGGLGFLIAERRLASENIIQERKDWRDKVRELAAKVDEAIISGIADENRFHAFRAELELRLNPHEAEDRKILDLIKLGSSAAQADGFNQRVALLLKHDWERAKRESNLWLCLFTMPTERVRFQDYRPGEPHTYARCWSPRWLWWRIKRCWTNNEAAQ